ncbi:MAG TPA: prolipoprotein diacylglyceryl transferase family protein, partial [Actinomycetota bacterium]|nr:prolipoprotein diacylglyceryl transferase family protein [Actinomycetota bacterium]
IGLFAVWYGAARFLTDFLRTADRTVLGLTGAQWVCLALVPAGAWTLRRAGGPGRKGPSVPPATGLQGRELEEST